MPPGRSSSFSGIKNTTLIDSTYNAPPKGVEAVVKMFGEYEADTKWIVVGDMLELGDEEKQEHARLADVIASIKPDKVLLFGPRVLKYTLPILQKSLSKQKVLHYDTHRELLLYIKANVPEGAAILFKGAAGMSLEAIVEKLLADKNDTQFLPRREEIYAKKRRTLNLQ